MEFTEVSIKFAKKFEKCICCCVRKCPKFISVHDNGDDDSYLDMPILHQNSYVPFGGQGHRLGGDAPNEEKQVAK